MNIGTLIRRHRKERRLTLKTVAERASISEGFLSQVENAVNSPSVETLIRICNSIGVNAGDLISQISRHEKIIVVRRSEWDDIELSHTGFVTRRHPGGAARLQRERVPPMCRIGVLGPCGSVITNSRSNI